MTINQVLVQVDHALRRLDWIDTDTDFDPAAAANQDEQADCWFRRWLGSYSTYKPQLNTHGHQCIQGLVAAGWTLRSSWPRPWGASTTKWLGTRLILGHASLFTETTQLHSVLSSRIGRHGSGQPDWPSWIDAALQHIARLRGQLLIAPGSTLAETVTQFASSAGLPFTTVRWTQRDEIEAWLSTLLDSICSTIDAANPASHQELFLSPMLEPADKNFCDIPLQDRISIALADRAWLLSLRTGGTLEKLIQVRLADQAFPTASVFVRLPNQPRSSPRVPRRATSSRPSNDLQWLEHGAVGWIVATRTLDCAGPLRHCHTTSTSSVTVQQISGPFPHAWRDLNADEQWPYLVHCTRGIAGPLPEESEQSFRQRQWSRREGIVWHPLETLSHICQEGRLRGTASMTRTAERCVSFSAVPIVPLLKRRTFRSHLGRWDWEPYGLLIRREALQACGARAVIYGDESDFERLDSPQRPYFQPRQRKGEQQRSWSEEREWRVLGDVDLRLLPTNSVIVFVRTQIEAQQFARHCPWPVLW